MVKFTYASQVETKDVAVTRGLLGVAIDIVDTQNFVAVASWDGVFRPQYALVISTNGEVYLARAGVYNNQVIVAVENSGDKIVAIAGEIGPYDSPARVVYVPETKLYYNAPIYVRISYENGDIYIPVGLPMLIVAILIATAAFGGYLAYQIVTSAREKAEAQKKVAETIQNVVNYAIQNNDVELLRTIATALPGVVAERDHNGEIIDIIKEYIVKLATPLVAILVLLLKFNVLIEIVRSLFRRWRE